MTVKPIKSETDYREALARLEVIFDAEPGTPEGDELKRLGLEVENYEKITISQTHPNKRIKCSYAMVPAGTDVYFCRSQRAKQV